MKVIRVASVVPVALALIAAGCGSSSKTKTAAASPSSAGASSAASSSPYGGGASSSASSTQPVALITTKHDKLGTILAYGSKRLTVYLFEGDKGHSSNCSGTCARAWPPVLGKPHAGTGATSADLGTIMRADGKTQVTYKGHPLYLFIKDKDDGDAYGEGVKAFGAEWYVLNPAGNKVDRS